MSTYTFNSIGYHQTADVAMHHHGQAECIVPTAGSCLVHCQDQQFRVAVGDCMYIPSGMDHDQLDPDQCLNYYIKISGLERRFGSQAIIFSIGDDDMLKNWCRDLSLCARANNETGDAAVDALLTAWVERLAYINNIDHYEQRDPYLQQALLFIHEHYPEDIGLDQIASAVNLSISHLGYVFRKYKQQSVMDYVRSIRMRHARRLLLDDYRSVSEVGVHVGYPDANYFARQFRMVHGESPRAWRKSQIM